MKTLVIYDNEGYILSVRQGEPQPREPIGVPFLWVEISEGKILKGIGEIGVDVSVSPNVPIFDDVQPSETEKLKAQLDDQEQAIAELSMIVGSLM